MELVEGYFLFLAQPRGLLFVTRQPKGQMRFFRICHNRFCIYSFRLERIDFRLIIMVAVTELVELQVCGFAVDISLDGFQSAEEKRLTHNRQVL